jgi:gliding motility-associated-like protein
MMKRSYKGSAALIVGMFFLAFNLQIKAQEYNTTLWRFSNPKPMGFTILDAAYSDNNNVIAVGSEGGIARSSDGGTTWIHGVYTFTNPAGLTARSAFQDLHVVSTTTAYAVGSLGAMIKTTDGGQNWSFIKTPLYNNGRNINAVWFVNKDTGYIGGQYNTPDSLPKLYFTRNGGATWDSLNAPNGGISRYGYVNNASYAPLLTTVTAKDKEIYAIQFVNDKLGYVSGSGLSTFLRHPAVNSTTGLPNGSTITSGAHHASLLWKFESGQLTDYSTTKERLGYSGAVAPITSSSRYGSPNNTTQTMRALHIINDSTVLMMSFNNNIVLRVHTGKNDSTANVAVPGRFEKGRYVTLNFPFPPGTPIVPIPNPQTLLVSNPYRIVKAPNGKLMAGGNFGLMATSTNNGSTWKMENSLPQGKNFSGNGTWAIAVNNAGKVLSMGTFGVHADSSSGGTWATKYLTTPASASYNEIEFADCNTGIATGAASITVTTDGGKTWIDRRRADFANLFISITGLAFPSVNKAYFTTNAGTLYRSSDLGVTMDPVYSNPNLQLQDVVVKGDSIWAVGSWSFSVPLANRTNNVIRSFDNGATWQVIGGFPVGGATIPILDKIFFTSSKVGYISGNRGFVYKTTDAGATWTNISPFATLNTTMTYKEIYALDDNTVYVVGNGFPRKVVYKSKDGGANWTDISSNIPATGVGNLNGILMHDENNGYVVTPGGYLLSTKNGGTSWELQVGHTANLFETMAFVPKSVPAGTPMTARKLFVTGANVSGAPLMEFGDTTVINISSTEETKGSCLTTANGSITITATGGIKPYSYSLNGGAFQTSNIFTTAQAGQNTLIIKDAGCQSVTKSVKIDTIPAPLVNAGVDQIIVAGEDVKLFGTTTAEVKSVSWTPANSITSGSNSFFAIAKPDITTTYKLSIVDNKTGCSGSDDVVITVAPFCIDIKNAFTPNGDGQNERWVVTKAGNCAKSVAVRVLNRYGQLVYRSDNYQNDWEGKVDGKPVPDGTYYYVITYNLVSGKTFQAKGDVTILR